MTTTGIVWVLFLPMVGGWRGKVCPGCISETVRCRKVILGRDIGFYPDLILDFAVVTLSLKILSGRYLRKRKL